LRFAKSPEAPNSTTVQGSAGLAIPSSGLFLSKARYSFTNSAAFARHRGARHYTSTP
jgi:hypothetical protein